MIPPRAAIAVVSTLLFIACGGGGSGAGDGGPSGGTTRVMLDFERNADTWEASHPVVECPEGGVSAYFSVTENATNLSIYMLADIDSIDTFLADVFLGHSIQVVPYGGGNSIPVMGGDELINAPASYISWSVDYAWQGSGVSFIEFWLELTCSTWVFELPLDLPPA